jgi:hypothetical protein
MKAKLNVTELERRENPSGNGALVLPDVIQPPPPGTNNAAQVIIMPPNAHDSGHSNSGNGPTHVYT